MRSSGPPLGDHDVAVVVDSDRGRPRANDLHAVDRLDHGALVDEQHAVAGPCRDRAGGRGTAGRSRRPRPAPRRAGTACRTAPGRRASTSRPRPASDVATRPSTISDDGRPEHRLRRPARPLDLDERVRLLRTSREHAARPPGVDPSPHDRHIVRDQRRRQRVARKPFVLGPVEREADGSIAVDPRSRRRASLTPGSRG